MAAIAAAPFLLNNVTVGIGSDTYEAACRTVRFDPTTPVVQWKGLAKNVHSFTGTPTWTVTLTFAQDFASESSLSKTLLNTDPGTALSLTFNPIAEGATITATILIQPGSIGGDIDTVPEATVTFVVQGQPELTPAA